MKVGQYTFGTALVPDLVAAGSYVAFIWALTPRPPGTWADGTLRQRRGATSKNYASE